MEDGPAEVGPAEVGLAEVGAAEVGTAEVGPAEVGPAEVGLAEVDKIDTIPSWGRYWVQVVFPPSVPGLNALPEYLQMLFVGHRSSQTSFVNVVTNANNARNCQSRCGRS